MGYVRNCSGCGAVRAAPRHGTGSPKRGKNSPLPPPGRRSCGKGMTAVKKAISRMLAGARRLTLSRLESSFFPIRSFFSWRAKKRERGREKNKKLDSEPCKLDQSLCFPAISVRDRNGDAATPTRELVFLESGETLSFRRGSVAVLSAKMAPSQRYPQTSIGVV